MLPDLESSPVSSRRNGHAVSTRTQSGVVRAFRLVRRLDGKLWLERGATSVAVEVVRCFPWTHPERLLSLRDTEGNEHGFVADVNELDPESRQALEGGLARSCFVLDIIRVSSVAEDFELRSFEVDTVQGPRRFQTALDAWPRRLENGGLVLEDVYGDLYRLAAPHKLDQKSRELMAAFVD